MIFIVLVARLIVRDRSRSGGVRRAINVLNLFNYCLIGALLSALVGASVSLNIDDRNFVPLFADWFSEQFATGVLILPCMLVGRIPQFDKKWMPFSSIRCLASRLRWALRWRLAAPAALRFRFRR